MTKQKNLFLLPSLLVISFLISGCAAGPEVQNNAENSGAEMIENQNNDAWSVEDRELTEQETNLIAQQDLLNEITAGGDISRCSELEMEQFFVNCEVYILSARAENASDIAVCDEASNDNIKERCVAQVEAIE